MSSDTPGGRPSPFLPVLLAWLVPGAGHLKIGRLWPGVFTFTAVLPLYVGGMWLAGFENVSHVRHPIYFWATHVFGGVLTIAAEFLTKNVIQTEIHPYESVGVLYTALACLLNLVAVSDVWARCSRGDPETRGAAPAPATGAGSEPHEPGTPGSETHGG